ncbi:MAG: nitroreductase family protein [Bacteriovoracia bacterium]
MSGNSSMLEEFKKVVESRRSVRVFDGSLVPPEVVQSCLDMALLAPNSSNLQPWEFYWARTPEVKARLVEACLSQPAAKTAAELIVCVARRGTWSRNSQRMLDLLSQQAKGVVPKWAHQYYAKLVPLMLAQGIFNTWGIMKKIFLMFRGFMRPTPRSPVSHSDMRVWAMKSCALACENLMLAFRAHGFDTCPMEGFDECRVKRLLNLPRDAEVAMVVGAGRRSAKGVYGPQVRFERELFIKEV